MSTNTEVKHTPTPWFASLQPDGRFDILSGPDLNTATVLCTRFDYSERNYEMYANAAFIVRACNSHEQLVAALRRITTEYIRTRAQQDGKKVGEDWSEYENIVCVEAARAALTAAGAKP